MSHGGADVDVGLLALHHTLGSGKYQAAPGNHTHPGGTVTAALQSSTASASTNNSTVVLDGITVLAGQKYLLIGCAVVGSTQATPTGSAGLFFSTTSGSRTNGVGVEGDTSPSSAGLQLLCFAYVAPTSDTTYYLNGTSGAGAGAVTWEPSSFTFSGLPTRGLVALRLA